MNREDKPGHPGLNNEDTWDRMNESKGLLSRLLRAALDCDNSEQARDLFGEAYSAIGNLIEHGMESKQ